MGFVCFWWKHNSRPNQTSHWHPQVKLIGRGPTGVSIANHWVWNPRPFCDPRGLRRGLYSLRATLDKGPRSEDQWIQAILVVESFKLVPRPLHEGPRAKSGKLSLNLHGTCSGGKMNWFGPKKQCQKESSWFGEPRIKLGTKVWSNSRIQFASNQFTLVPRKLDPGPSSKVGLSDPSPVLGGSHFFSENL
jgi:hypothetical protein